LPDAGGKRILHATFGSVVQLRGQGVCRGVKKPRETKGGGGGGGGGGWGGGGWGGGGWGLLWGVGGLGGFLEVLFFWLWGGGGVVGWAGGEGFDRGWFWGFLGEVGVGVGGWGGSEQGVKPGESFIDTSRQL